MRKKIQNYPKERKLKTSISKNKIQSSIKNWRYDQCMLRPPHSKRQKNAALSQRVFYYLDCVDKLCGTFLIHV